MDSPTPSQALIVDDRTLDNTGYCLLSLDGGGVRGLSTLYILQSIMTRLNYEREEAGLKPRKPCEIFDLIGGTSTGGLIAIMLGHLEMTVKECIDAYIELMKHIFEKKQNRSWVGKLGGVKAQFSSEALKTAIAKVIEKRGRSLDERFESRTKPRCKVFVCTKFQKTSAITRLRNYRLPTSSDFQPTILEAALATTAAPTYFSEAAIEGSKFVDGAIGANNPAVQVEEEACDLWCEETGLLQPLVKCFISVGTGHPGIRSVSDKGLRKLIESLQKEATETESTNDQFLGRWRDYVEKGRCFRFNVNHGLENVRLAEYEQADLIHQAASTYLGGRMTMQDVRRCVGNLRTKEYEPTPQFIKKLKEQSLAPPSQRPSNSLSRATSSEITELIRLGNNHLKANPARITSADLRLSLHYFTKALHFLKNDANATPKQVARVCQKLMETELGLSMTSPELQKRKEHADLARDYGETALDNVLNYGDECMAAQVEFLLACVSTWRVCLQARLQGVDPMLHPARAGVEILMEERLQGLRRFVNLDIEHYEGQARKYLGFLKKVVR